MPKDKSGSEAADSERNRILDEAEAETRVPRSSFATLVAKKYRKFAAELHYQFGTCRFIKYLVKSAATIFGGGGYRSKRLCEAPRSSKSTDFLQTLTEKSTRSDSTHHERLVHADYGGRETEARQETSQSTRLDTRE